MTGDVVIVGAGVCGTAAAFELRRKGYPGRVTIIEEELGLPYERPLLSKHCDPAKRHRALTTQAALAEADITLRHARVVSIDRSSRALRLPDGAVIAFDRLLLATGSEARRPDFAGGGAAFVLRNASDADRIYDAAAKASNIVIAGAGLIGLELAAGLSSLGKTVTLVDPADTAMMRVVPRPVAETIVARHRDHGARFHFGTGIAAILPGRVRLTTGIELPADMTVAAIGAVPRVDIAVGAQLESKRGIVVDDTFRTSDPAIFAAGDCALSPHPLHGLVRMETWRNAEASGIAAATAMLGMSPDAPRPISFWSDQYDCVLEGVGDPRAGTSDVIVQPAESAVILYRLSNGNRIVAAFAFGQRNEVVKPMRLAEKLIIMGGQVTQGSFDGSIAALRLALRRSSN